MDSRNERFRAGLDLQSGASMKPALPVAWCCLSFVACSSHSLERAVSDLTISPSAIDFGAQPAGAHVTRTATLTNAGATAVTLASTRIDSDARSAFRLLTSVPASLQPGATLTLSIEYVPPSAPGADGATLVIEGGAQNATLGQVSLAGQSVSVLADGGVNGDAGSPPDAGLPADAGTDAGCNTLGPAGCLDRWIAFDSDRDAGGRHLYVIRPGGSSLKQLTREAFVDEEPAFSPDGTRIAFTSNRAGSLMQIFILTLSTSVISQVTHGPDADSQPSWSPDGTLIAFHRDAAVFVIAPDGTGELPVVSGDPVNAYAHPSFTPDGQWIVLSHASEIDEVRPDGTGLRVIAPSTTWTQETPELSPGGAQVIVGTDCGTGVEAVYWVPISGVTTNACHDGTEVIAPGRKPAWGPGFIAYESPAPSGATLSNAEILIVPANGGTAYNVTQSSADNRNPTWAPAGTLIP
jgi:Tol biopolymer transport system component